MTNYRLPALSRSLLRKHLLASAGLLCITAALPAHAQTAATPDTTQPTATQTDAVATPPAVDQSPPAADDAGTSGADIVVTGTLLRGVAPVGTNVVGITRAEVIATGATNANQILAQVPQISNSFNSTPRAAGDVGNPINRPNIRNLGVNGGTTTLVLMNGHRLVGVGVIQTSPDPSVIPPGALERVEVVPDGGSSIYGSDAIGGVVNFITRKRFNGLELNANYGFADDYYSYDVNGTAGKDWGSGSILVSYEYTMHDNILGRDRDYVSQNLTARGGSDFRTTACAPGTVTANGVNYALPGFTPGQNLCDQSDYADIYPREHRHNVFASLTQQLDSTTRFDVEAYWSRRVTTPLLPQSRTTGTIDASNPYFHSIAGETSQTVSYSYDAVFGPARRSQSIVDAWGVTPSFTKKIGGDWQLRALANYGRSYTQVVESIVNPTLEAAALAGTTTATALNPYNPAATNASVLAGIHDWENYASSVQELAEGRLVVDGTLFTLPGGGVHVAVGGEYHYENLNAVSLADRVGHGELNPHTAASRNVKSAFGELLIPIFGNDNGFAGMRRLDISASVRYDDYNDVGGTTNPKVGFTYKPANSVTIRGNFGTSFNAPSLSDTTGAVDTRAQVIGVSPFRTATSPSSDLFRRTVLLAGGNPNLTPQKADTFSIGGDFKPVFAPGLTLSGTYYKVKFKNAIALAPFYTPAIFTTAAYAKFVTINPTLAQAQALLAGFRLDGISSIAALYASGQSPYAIFDARRNNLGSTTQDGIDFNAVYQRSTGFGSINASFGGTYTLNRKSAPVAGAPEVDEFEAGTAGTRFSFVGALGATVGNLTGRAQISHSQGYDVVGYANQTRIGSFDTVDLYFSYALRGEGLLRDTALTLNVNNVADQDPPFLNTSSTTNVSLSGYGNGSTLGRMFQFGVRKKF